MPQRDCYLRISLVGVRPVPLLSCMYRLTAPALGLLLLPLSACGTSGRAGYAADGMSEVVVTGQATSVDRAFATAPAEDSADRKLVRDATQEIEVASEDEVDSALEEARQITGALEGYVSWEGPGAMVLRIPDARLDEALDRLAALGDEERREVRVHDVTAAYTDLEIRLTNARALQTRLRDLLDRAETVDDVLAVERELARVTTEVDMLEGQLRLLQNQVAYSTVRLHVHDDVEPGPLGWVFVGLYETVKWLFVWD